MIRLKKAIGIAAILMAAAAGAVAQIVSQPAITAVGVQVFCQGLQPFVSFVLPVKPNDRGRAGLVYVGMKDQAAANAMFLQGSSWYSWSSGMFPVYAVSSWLNDQSFTLPLNSNLAGGGWSLYVGYGVLTDEAELRVKSYVQTMQQSEAIAGKKVSGIDPDHYRRTLVQSDMVQSGKYSYINTGLELNSSFCQTQSEANQ